MTPTAEDEARIVAKYHLGKSPLRQNFGAEQVELPKPAKPAFDPRIPCIHLGQVIDKTSSCGTCWIFACGLHGTCKVVRRGVVRGEVEGRVCASCEDYLAEKIG